MAAAGHHSRPFMDLAGHHCISITITAPAGWHTSLHYCELQPCRKTHQTIPAPIRQSPTTATPTTTPHPPLAHQICTTSCDHHELHAPPLHPLPETRASLHYLLENTAPALLPRATVTITDLQPKHLLCCSAVHATVSLHRSSSGRAAITSIAPIETLVWRKCTLPRVRLILDSQLVNWSTLVNWPTLVNWSTKLVKSSQKVKDWSKEMGLTTNIDIFGCLCKIVLQN